MPVMWAYQPFYRKFSLSRSRDLKGPKAYDKLKTAFEKGQPVPQMIIPVSKDETLPEPGKMRFKFQRNYSFSRKSNSVRNTLILKGDYWSQ